jgi:hypothetical protein
MALGTILIINWVSHFIQSCASFNACGFLIQIYCPRLEHGGKGLSCAVAGMALRMV